MRFGASGWVAPGPPRRESRTPSDSEGTPCGARSPPRAHDTAFHLTENVLPEAPYRRLTLSFPVQLRSFVLARDSALLSQVLRYSSAPCSPSSAGQPGKVTFSVSVAITPSRRKIARALVDRARRGTHESLGAPAGGLVGCLALPGGRSCPGAQPSRPKTGHSRPPRRRGTSEAPLIASDLPSARRYGRANREGEPNRPGGGHEGKNAMAMCCCGPARHGLRHGAATGGHRRLRP